MQDSLKMDIAVITSNSDPASVNIRDMLFERTGSRAFSHSGNRISVYEFDEELIHLDWLDRRICADLFIFASKHSGKREIPSFSVHAPGNWGAAEHGGVERQLCPVPSAVLKGSIIRLALDGFEVLAKAQGVFLSMLRNCSSLLRTKVPQIASRAISDISKCSGWKGGCRRDN
ncbi:hypothetical protein HYU11_02305 [Candidatus Woesearchaeota archaeon]|nr:hypothetical protein [Candidatus Woesearchaeota archaeon]